VIPFDAAPIAVPSFPMVSTSQPLVHPPSHPPPSRESYFSRHFETAHPNGHSSTPSAQSDHLPTPPLEFAHPVIASTHQESHPHFVSLDYSHRLHPQLYLRPRPAHRYHTGPNQLFYHPMTSRPTSPDSSSSSEGSPPLSNPSFPYTDQKEPSLPQTLKADDVLFWHHLARSGEIPAVTEDARARGPPREAAADARPDGRVTFNR